MRLRSLALVCLVALSTEQTLALTKGYTPLVSWFQSRSYLVMRGRGVRIQLVLRDLLCVARVGLNTPKSVTHCCVSGRDIRISSAQAAGREDDRRVVSGHWQAGLSVVSRLPHCNISIIGAEPRA